MSKHIPSRRLIGLAIAAIAFIQHATAQTGLPFPADVRFTQILLPTPDQQIFVRYALVDKRLIYFSPIFPQKAEINGQPLVAADGSLRIPTGSPQTLKVTFQDPGWAPSGLLEIANGLANAPDVRQANEGIVPQVSPASVLSVRKVALIYRGTDGAVALTGEVILPNQEGNPAPHVNFVLDKVTLELLSQAKAGDVEIAYFQDYPARFDTTNVKISVVNLEKQVGNLRQSLAPIPDGAPGGGTTAGILLDATFGLGLTQNGTLNKSSLVSDHIQRNVTFDVLYRSGASIETALVRQLIDFALSKASDFLQKSQLEGNDTFVTLLLGHDVQFTTALGSLDEFATQMENNQVDELFTKLIESIEENTSVNVGVKAKVYGYGQGKGSLSVNLSNSQFREQLRQEFHQSFRNASAWFKGSIPYLPGIRFVSNFSVENIRWQEFSSALTEFTTGNITLYRAFNLASLAGRQDGLTLYQMFDQLIAQNEQFLQNLPVPLVQVGDYEAPSSAADSAQDWIDAGGGDFVHRVAVSFAKTFDAPPSVVVSFKRLDSIQSDLVPEKINVRALAENITASGFTLRLRVYNSGNRDTSLKPPKWLIGASWVATGTTKLGASQQASFEEFRDSLKNHRSLVSSEQQFATTPWISPAVVPDANNQYAVRFSSVPRRAYQIESSPDLQQWSPAGSLTAGASDLNSTFRFTPDERYPHLFFRVASQ